MNYSRDDLGKWLIEALVENDGQGFIVDVCRTIWEKHENDLRNSGDLFYTWQYDVRWAAHQLHERNKLEIQKRYGKSVWKLTDKPTKFLEKK